MDNNLNVAEVTNILSRDILPGEVKWNKKSVMDKPFKSGQKRGFVGFIARHLANYILDEALRTGETVVDLGISKKGSFRQVFNAGLRAKVARTVFSGPEEDSKVTKEESEPTESSLANKKFTDLKKIAKEKGISFKIGMNKKDLVTLIENN